MAHPFTNTILKIISEDHENDTDDIFQKSILIQYLNHKTKSANRGSKARGSFGSIYAIYVLVEDYIKNNFHLKGNYSKYVGAKFSDLFKRQRELPFGSKLQNHALNHRMNQEFRKFFPTSDLTPIIRDVDTNRYWFNQNLLRIKVSDNEIDIAPTVISIIDEYVNVKRDSFDKFIRTCSDLRKISDNEPKEVLKFIVSLLEPNVDARIFEIVSYAILKYYYSDQEVFFGFSIDEIEKENLKLFKTGRTNANDGGIDFVMKPLGRFFQVTETTDVHKYFLDIDKIERFPITFVIKSNEDIETLKSRLEEEAKKKYIVEIVVDKYISCVEEIINLPILITHLEGSVEQGLLPKILDEIITWSKVEFNIEDEFEAEQDPDKIET